MVLALVKPGGWANEEILTSDQMDDLQAEMVKAIDGVDGGTYTLSTHLAFAGAGEVRIDNVLRVRTGADFFIDSGATATFNDSATFNDDTEFYEDNVFRAAGSTEFEATHTVIVGDLDDLTVDADSHVFRVPLVPLGIAELAAAPTWETGTVAGGPQWENTNASAFALIYFALPLIAGDIVTAIETDVIGGNGAGHGGVDPTNKLRARFMQCAAVDASGYTALSTLVDPATGATYDGAHGFIMNAASDAGTFPHTVLDRQYVLEIRSENGGTAANNENLIVAVKVTITRNKVVSTNTFGA